MFPMRILIRASVPLVIVVGVRVWGAVRLLQQRAQMLRDEFHEEALGAVNVAAR